LSVPVKNKKPKARSRAQNAGPLARTPFASEDLLLKEDAFSGAFHYAAIGMALVSPEGRWLKVNKALSEIVGYQKEELLTKTFQEITHPDDLASDLDQVRQVLAGEIQSYQMEKRYFHKNGRVVWVLLSVSLVRDGQGNPLYFVAQIQNITSRKHAEEILRQAENQYRGLIDNALVGIFQASADGKFLSCNPSMARMLGYDSPARMTMSITDIGNQLYVDPERRRELCRRLAAEHVVRDFECELYRSDGKRIWVSVTARAIFEDGTICGLEGTTVDISERKLLEDQLKHTARMEAVGRLAGGVAHDFNNLIGVMTGYGSLLREGLPADSPLQGFAEQICRAGERGAALARQLLTFSRKQSMQTTVLNINRLLDEMRSMLSRLIGEDITLELIRSSEPSMIKADPLQFEQIIMNLAANARDAMPQGGSLTIETFRTEKAPANEAGHEMANPRGYAVLRVRDSGKGMDTETQNHIFEPFFTTKGREGTGLGLATVYGIVKQSGGQISVFSELGKGTEFEIYLPLADHIEECQKQPEPSMKSRSGSETILLVEDDEAMRSLAHTCLQKNGYRVLSMRNGSAAASAVERYDGPIHLLLTDVIMPGINGRELADTLKVGRPGMRVLFMSGYTADVVHNYNPDNRTRVLEKPFTVDALLNAVRVALDEKVETASVHFPPLTPPAIPADHPYQRSLFKYS
jgi:two-component system, cell cycle sensor histidine kinase and response regulator CckA